MDFLKTLETNVVCAPTSGVCFFSGILTPTLRAKVLRARIAGRSGADAIECITHKALTLATFYFDEFTRAVWD